MNPTSNTSHLHRFYLDLACLALGRFHHNIGEKHWNRILAEPMDTAAKSFWTLHVLPEDDRSPSWRSILNA